MNTHDLLRKLTPLMPDQAQRWERTLDVADPTTRALLERTIAATAHRVLGNPRDLLLSLPPKNKARGALTLGLILYAEAKWPLGLSERELLQHLAIFGRSGAGKTNLVFSLLLQLARRKTSFIFFDWKRTARHLIPQLPGHTTLSTPGRSLRPFSFNPFIPPPGLEPPVYANLVVDILCDAYTIGDGARSLMQRVLLEAFNEDKIPTATTLLKRIEQIPDQERVRGWKISARRALTTVEMMTREESRTTQQRTLKQLLTQQTILELDGLAPSNKQFFLPILCLWIYYTRLASRAREELSLVLIIEEAHHILHRTTSREETVMEMLFRQCREIGIALIVIDQHPSLLSQAALGNTYTSICLNLKDPQDINKAAALSHLTRADAHHFTTLPVGHGIVKLQDRWRGPILVRFPHINIDKGAVTDDQLSQRRKRVLEESREKSIPAANASSTLSPRSTSQGFEFDALARTLITDTASSDHLAFLRDVQRHPTDGVDQRYKRLSLSTAKGHRIKQSLVAHGLLQQERIKTGRTTRALLRLSTQATRALGEKRDRAVRESLAHEYWKRRYADRMIQNGYDTTIEAPRTQGHIDILANKNGHCIAIEIETGKSDACINVRRDLLYGCTRVIIIATTERARHAVTKQLNRAGLNLPTVIVALRDDLPLSTLARDRLH